MYSVSSTLSNCVQESQYCNRVAHLSLTLSKAVGMGGKVRLGARILQTTVRSSVKYEFNRYYFTEICPVSRIYYAVEADAWRNTGEYSQLPYVCPLQFEICKRHLERSRKQQTHSRRLLLWNWMNCFYSCMKEYHRGNVHTVMWSVVE